MVDKQLIVRSLDLANPQAVQERGKLSQPNGERLNGVFQSADRSINVLRTATARGAPLRAVGTEYWHTRGYNRRGGARDRRSLFN